MSVYKTPASPYWQIRFEISGHKVKRSSGTRDKRAAEKLEGILRADLWRQIEFGEQRWTWDDAVEKFRLETGGKPDRTWRSIKILNEYLAGELLTDIDYDALLELRKSLEARLCNGKGWKTKRTWKPSTCNRVLAVAGTLLSRCASDDWKKMIAAVPTIPLFELEKIDPKWITREQAHTLLGHFPQHTRDMMIVALATGLRKSNIAGLEWDRVDLARRCCYVPGYLTKSGEPIPVPLNDDAIAVLERWKAIHAERADDWSAEVRRYVFVYRCHAPIKKLTTAMWRRECAAAGLAGVTFHSMRHSWASWQTQAGTPLRMLQELGGWADLQMPQRYSHLDPGHLAQYADRSLLGADTRQESVPVDVSAGTGDSQVIESGGKGGTRTLDPGIMSAVL